MVLHAWWCKCRVHHPHCSSISIEFCVYVSESLLASLPVLMTSNPHHPTSAGVLSGEGAEKQTRNGNEGGQTRGAAGEGVPERDQAHGGVSRARERECWQQNECRSNRRSRGYVKGAAVALATRRSFDKRFGMIIHTNSSFHCGALKVA